jgi:hypothetical protein
MALRLPKQKKPEKLPKTLISISGTQQFQRFYGKTMTIKISGRNIPQ